MITVEYISRRRRDRSSREETNYEIRIALSLLPTSAIPLIRLMLELTLSSRINDDEWNDAPNSRNRYPGQKNVYSPRHWIGNELYPSRAEAAR